MLCSVDYRGKLGGKEEREEQELSTRMLHRSLSEVPRTHVGLNLEFAGT